MAAKDKLCGNNLVELKDLDLGAWIDRPGDVDCKDKKWNAFSTWYIGRPLRTWSGVLGKLMLLRNCWGFDPCAATSPETQDFNRFVIWFIPIAWYFFWFLPHRGLVWHIWCFREELVKAARRVQPLPQTFWPSALCVESISPSAPVPPAFICPILPFPRISFFSPLEFYSLFFFSVPRLRFFSYFSSNVYMRAFVWL